MIHTKQPANHFTVFLTGYVSYEPKEVNEIFTKGMQEDIEKSPKVYGEVRRTDVQGVYKGKTERTLQIRCSNREQVSNLAALACLRYNQECVLMVASQTHTSYLINFEGAYGLEQEVINQIGTMQRVDAPQGDAYSVIDGNTWEVR